MILRKLSQSCLGLFFFILIGLFSFEPLRVSAFDLTSSQSSSKLDGYDPYALISEVNALRSVNGLPALNPDPILMSVSQGHADYMASIGTVTHYSADGSRPFQRSLAAGYPVAGDLSLGGFHSENIIAGRNMTPAEAVSNWTGDAPHLNTMLSPNFTDIGAGVSIVGDKVYYVIDASRKSGSAVPAYTPQTSNGTPVYNLNPLVSTIFPNTPSADGSIIHVVKPGETLWLIAITYGVKINEIAKWNNLSNDPTIYPGQKLIVKEVSITQTPIPVVTLTPEATQTHIPSLTSTLVKTIVESPTGENANGENGKTNVVTSFIIPLAIITGALIIAGVVAFSSGRRK
jgi:LysM repeat protein